MYGILFRVFKENSVIKSVAIMPDWCMQLHICVIIPNIDRSEFVFWMHSKFEIIKIT